jgi:two-component system, NtrC family, sensor kinase
LFEAEIAAQHRQLGAAVQPMVVDLWRSTGRGRVFELFTAMQQGQERVQVRWVWFAGKPPEAQSPLVMPAKIPSVIEGKAVSLTLRDRDGNSGRFVTYYPIELPGEPAGALEIVESLERRDAYTRDTIRRTGVLLGSLVLISALLMSLVGVRLVGRPLQRLIDFTRQVGGGDLSPRIELHSRDELSELATALNQMCDQLANSQQRLRDETAERIATLEQLRHGDRLRTVGRLASGVAHELGTPLNVVSGRASLISSGKLSQEDTTNSANAIRTEADRMAKIIRQLLDFARRSTPQRSRVDLRDVVRQTASLLEPLAKKRGADLRLEFERDDLSARKLPAPDFHAEIDAGQIQQVLSNIVLNAIQSRERGAVVSINLRAAPPLANETHDDRFVIIDISDNGCGIAEEHLPQLFEPFFTTKEIGEGTGLGLSIADGIVSEHGGRIDVESTVGSGSRFSIWLPLSPGDVPNSDTRQLPD